MHWKRLERHTKQWKIGSGRHFELRLRPSRCVFAVTGDCLWMESFTFLTKPIICSLSRQDCVNRYFNNKKKEKIFYIFMFQVDVFKSDEQIITPQKNLKGPRHRQSPQSYIFLFHRLYIPAYMQLVDGSEACMCVCVFVLEQWPTSLRSSYSFPQLLGFRSQASRQSQASSYLECTHSLCVASGLQAEFSNVGTTVWRSFAPVRSHVDTQRCCLLTRGPAFYTSTCRSARRESMSAGRFEHEKIVKNNGNCCRTCSAVGSSQKCHHSFSDFSKWRLERRI